MGAKGGGRLRLVRHALLPLFAVLLLAGCASMPSSGEVRKVSEGQRADSDSQVRVFGIGPSPGESASDIVNGFLEATTSSESDFVTAKSYLSKQEKKRWKPDTGITVFSGELAPREVGGTGRKEGYTTVTLSATKSAVVDAKHAYEPDHGTFSTSFHLVKEDNQWRIDGLANGLVLSDLDFQRIYHSVNMYYFARLGPDEHPAGGSSNATLVADPVYLRIQNDPLVSTVSALLGGPTDWLSHVVTTATPAGTRLEDKGPDHGVSVDDSQRLQVRLGSAADKLHGQRCTQLAAQLFATVQAQASAQLASAEVDHADGSTACVLHSSEALGYGPENLVGSSPRPYFIEADSQHRLLELTDDGKGSTPKATPVPGPFGSSKAYLDSVAVRRDQEVAAGVRSEGRDLVVGSLVTGQAFGKAVVTSNVKDGLSAPSWDGFDDLWVADRDPDSPKLLVLPHGTGTPIEVPVPDLDGRIQSLRVASDGVRIALVVQQGSQTRLMLGRIVREGTTQHPQFAVNSLRPLTPSGENMTSVSWAGASKLVVLDTEPGGAQQIEYISSDGSAGSALQGVSEATSVASSENAASPLLASYNGRVYELPTDANWKQVSPKGSDPVYPG
ncbi:LpqB family beta-propeller domain-containing protein [Actinacidiphila sp. bgisy144]|uniref:LpqB family beta-propeller domain-containing protein n=1 Tax=Actinacidiphila sp. bgisy144 TaxID=3413791 RepID=UPI003EB9D363